MKSTNYGAHYVFFSSPLLLLLSLVWIFSSSTLFLDIFGKGTCVRDQTGCFRVNWNRMVTVLSSKMPRFLRILFEIVWKIGKVSYSSCHESAINPKAFNRWHEYSEWYLFHFLRRGSTLRDMRFSWRCRFKTCEAGGSMVLWSFGILPHRCTA